MGYGVREKLKSNFPWLQKTLVDAGLGLGIESVPEQPLIDSHFAIAQRNQFSFVESRAKVHKS